MRSYKVPFVDFSRHYNPEMTEEIIGAIRGVLKRGDFVLRGDLEEFESKMTDFLSVKQSGLVAARMPWFLL